MTKDDEIENLRFRVAELEEQIGLGLRHPNPFSLSRTETAVLGILLANPHPRRTAFMAAIYGNRLDPPCDKVIDVVISKMRKTLAPHGITINTDWGSGYSMPEPSKARARQLMEAA
jgi:two-component system cell cycle response regulator CtrA